MGKWLVPELLTNEEVCDRIMLEQFLDVLHPELQVWVRNHTAASSAQAADLVETFMAARQSRRSPQQQNWRRPYQAAQQEPDKTFPGKSVGGSGRGFKPSNSPNSPGVGTTSARAPRVLLCHGCGQPGRIRPNYTVKRMSDSRICYIPGHSKHFAGTTSDVTVPVKLSGKTLVDTGSSLTSFFLKSCLKSDFKPVGKVRVSCIHGDESEHQTDEVLIEINGQKYLTVGILDKCPYPVILGQDVAVLTELLQSVDTVDAYVTTRAQARVGPDTDVWSELPFESCPGGKPKKFKAERRRAKVSGTAMQSVLPTVRGH
ncbi:uncharacterized protein LOC120572822 isoform X1 [Perca fluviatilis]|uniref:uncharacterized protein LOC120572822 isoform X1 n=1 Tax=Perca fluviatilis TaxID=8168 RepID=UPI0019668936|nr:uncharacterized protein LOC120572822 isoform X1 [Perca fluviatilis]